MITKEYGEDFFDDQAEKSYKAAKQTIPILMDLLNPRSVVDMGCGVGAWLKAFQEAGATRILGVEGDYVKNIKTYVPKEYYKYHNLETEFISDERFDLAISLEVGEHLKDSSASVFVNSLCRLADVVLFSAAIIGQEGTMHINEQFPEYWATHFNANGFVPVDYIRPRVWDKSDIEVWYRQNMILYVKETTLNTLPQALQTCQKETHSNYLFRIHPELYLNILKRKYPFHFANYWWFKFKRSFKKF